MKLDPELYRTVRRLADWRILYPDLISSAQVGSGHSNMVATVEARSKLRPHAPLLVRQRLADGSESRVLWGDEGHRCGLVYVGQGDEFPEEPRTFKVREFDQLHRADPVHAFMRQLEMYDRARYVRLCHLIEKPLRLELVPFGAPFDEDGGERLAAPARGFKQPTPHGPGVVAHWTPLAVERWGADLAETRLLAFGGMIQHCDPDGKRLPGRNESTDEDRAFQRAIRMQAGDLVRADLSPLADVLYPRRKRAAERRAAA